MSLATVFGHENKNENAKHKTVRETQEDKKIRDDVDFQSGQVLS